MEADILDDLNSLLKQATTERSHYYVAGCCRRAANVLIRAPIAATVREEPRAQPRSIPHGGRNRCRVRFPHADRPPVQHAPDVPAAIGLAITGSSAFRFHDRRLRRDAAHPGFLGLRAALKKSRPTGCRQALSSHTAITRSAIDGKENGTRT